MQCEDIKEKRRITNLEKYGVENLLQREDVKEKLRQTNLENMGFLIQYWLKMLNLMQYQSIYTLEDLKLDLSVN